MTRLIGARIFPGETIAQGEVFYRESEHSAWSGWFVADREYMLTGEEAAGNQYYRDGGLGETASQPEAPSGAALLNYEVMATPGLGLGLVCTRLHENAEDGDLTSGSYVYDRGLSSLLAMAEAHERKFHT